MGWYKHWFGTRYYTLLYGHRDKDEARPWAKAIVDKWGMHPGSDLLDVACGRGRHARWFASHGMNVTGIDLSQTSIDEARASVREAQFHVHDIREPFATGCFEGAYCLFTSLGYSDSLDDDRKVFSSVAQALRPGGRFVLDFMNMNTVLRDLVVSEEKERSGVRFKIERALVGEILVKGITVIDGDDVHRYEERVLALRPEQLEQMALEAGFVIEDRTDGPVLAPFDADRSKRFVLWTRKPIP